MKELRRFTTELSGENVVRFRDSGKPLIDSIKMEATVELIQSLEGQTFRIEKVNIPLVEKADSERITLEIVALEEGESEKAELQGDIVIPPDFFTKMIRRELSRQLEEE